MRTLLGRQERNLSLGQRTVGSVAQRPAFATREKAMNDYCGGNLDRLDPSGFIMM